MQELQSLKSAHAAELETLRKQSEERDFTVTSEYQSQLQSMKEAHDAEISRVTSDYVCKLQSVETGHAQELRRLRLAHSDELDSLRKQLEERDSTFSIQHQKPATAAAARPPGLPEPTGVVERFCVDGYAAEVTRFQREMMANMKRESQQLDREKRPIQNALESYQS